MSVGQAGEFDYSGSQMRFGFFGEGSGDRDRGGEEGLSVGHAGEFDQSGSQVQSWLWV